MAIAWGSWTYGGGNGMRVGVEVIQGPVSAGSSTCTFTINLFTENQYRYADNQTLSWTGAIGGSVDFYNSSGTGGLQRQSLTYTYTYPAGVYGPGSSASTFIEARIAGAYNGVSPVARVNFIVPERPYGAPAAPASVVATRSSDQRATVTWVNRSSAAAPYENQLVYVRGHFTSWGNWILAAALPGSSNTHTITTLQPNIIYEFLVVASNRYGVSPDGISNQIWNTPGAPSDVTSGAVDSGAITTTWTDTSYQASTRNTFAVERSIDNGATWTQVASGVTTTSWTDSSPNAGTNQYRVAAHTSVSNLTSAFTAGNTITTIVPPLAPTNLLPNGQTADWAVNSKFVWTHRHGGDGSKQSAFELQTSSDNGATWVTRATVTSTAQEWVMPAGTLPNGATYLWRVRTKGVSSLPYGPYSAPATVRASRTPVVTVTSPGPFVTSMPITVTWSYAQAEGLAQTAWIAQLYRTDGSFVEQAVGTGASGGQSSVTFKTLAEDGDSFTVTIGAQSSAGLWSQGAQATFTLRMPLPAEVAVTAEYQPCTGTTVLDLTALAPLPAPVDATNLILNPSFRTTAGQGVIRTNLFPWPDLGGAGATVWGGQGGGAASLTYSSDSSASFARAVWTTAPTGSGGFPLNFIGAAGDPALPAQSIMASAYVRPSITCLIYVQFGVYAGASSTRNVSGVPVECRAGEWTRVSAAFTPNGTSENRYQVRVYASAGGPVFKVGDTLDVSRVLVEQTTQLDTWFSGATRATGEFTYAWTGTPSASTSVQRGAVVASSWVRPYAASGAVGWQAADGESQVIKPAPLARGTILASSPDGRVTVPANTPGSGLVTLSLQGSPVDVTVQVTVWDYAVTPNARRVLQNVVLPATGDEVPVAFSVPSTSTAQTLGLVLYSEAFGGATTGTWPLGATLTARRALLVPGVYNGPFFDGSTQASSTAIYSWTGTPDASTSLATGRAETSVDTVTIQRRVGDLGEWVTLVEELALPSTFLDILPATAGLNQYRVIAANSQDSYRSMPILDVWGTDGDRGGEFAGFLAYGPAFSRVLRLRGDLKLSSSSTHEQAAVALLGRRWPLPLSGVNATQSVSVSGTVRWADHCDPGGDPCLFDSPREDWEEAGITADLVCWRDYTGRRLFGILGQVGTSDVSPGMASVDFSVTRTDYAENYGLTAAGASELGLG